MRQVIIFSILLFSIFTTKGQTKKIDNSTIWASLYPNNSNFDSKSRLIRNVNRDGANLELKTALAKTFYYKVGAIEKVAVILFSYDATFTNPEHPLFAEMDIATFVLTGGSWTKQRFVQNWEEATGGMYDPKAQFKKYNNINCLVMTFTTDMGMQNAPDISIGYYNIETLKKVK